MTAENNSERWLAEPTEENCEAVNVGWLYGCPFKKNGRPGKAERCLYAYWSVES